MRTPIRLPSSRRWPPRPERDRSQSGGKPGRIRYSESGGDVLIEVIDQGHGMSSEFVRTRLFQPFASTKESGFGIGAYEARP
jgi:signal transduction histidine kinase